MNNKMKRKKISINLDEFLGYRQYFCEFKFYDGDHFAVNLHDSKSHDKAKDKVINFIIGLCKQENDNGKNK